LEIEQHRQSCAECTRLFAEEQNFEAWMTDGLKQSQRSALTWERTERAILAAAQSGKHPDGSPRNVQWSAGWQAFWGRLRFIWNQTPRAWAGVAMAWIGILVLNLTAPSPDPLPIAHQAAPSQSEMRFALKQKQLLLTELAVPVEASSTEKIKPGLPRPRTQRAEGDFRT